jgi:hypothetical protein
MQAPFFDFAAGCRSAAGLPKFGGKLRYHAQEPGKGTDLSWVLMKPSPAPQRGGDLDRKLARIGEMRARLFRENHRRIGGKIAMRRIARRLDHKALQIEVRGQAPARGDPAKNRSDQLLELGEKIHSLTNFRGCASWSTPACAPCATRPSQGSLPRLPVTRRLFALFPTCEI